jgi:RHS repeat-associated protein
MPDRPARIAVTYAGQARFQLVYTWVEDGTGVHLSLTLQDSADILLDGGIGYQRRSGGFIYSEQWDLPELSGASPSRHVRHYFDSMGNEVRLERFKSFFTSDIRQAPFAVTHYTRDSRGHATQISHRNQAGELLFPEASMALTRTPGGVITGVAEPGNAATLTYDAGLQLTGVAHSARPSESYTYDAAGNRLASHFQGTPATVGPGNRLLEVGDLALEYDFEGNLVRETNTATGAIREFSYDHNNQLVGVQTRASAGAEPVTVAEYGYDWLGLLIRRTEGGTTTWILHDRTMPFAEFADGQNVIRRMYFYDLARLDRVYALWDAALGERWFLTDHRGSVRGVFSVDASNPSVTVPGAITPIAWADYDAFGQLVVGDPALLGNLRFAGRFWSDASGLYENRARHYSPSLGRFLQEDPIFFRSGDLNLYSYAGNDPHNRTDPTGTVEAMEYAELLTSIAENLILAGDVAQIGICVCQMLGAAADGFSGVQSSDPTGCLSDLFQPFPIPGVFGAGVKGFVSPPSGPSGLSGVAATCGQ